MTKEVINELKKYTVGKKNTEKIEISVLNLNRLIFALEEQESKTGHWIDNNNGTISCSYCHTWFNKNDRYSYMNYCPYCNTKMIKPQKRSDKE